ncbi:MAG: hypothetical protein O9342_04775, partial [Beijerinckiaceae bacterium]|nr:hypothetical protein [Beijerinckiaceae bacterium]
SCSFSIPMICSSEKRDGFIRRLLRDGLYSFLEEVQGLRSPVIVEQPNSAWVNHSRHHQAD